MERRSFLKNISLITATALLPSFITGCSEEDGKISTQEAVTKHAASVSVLEVVQKRHLQAVKKLEEFDYALKTDEHKNRTIEMTLTLPWYMGNKIEMDKDTYFISKYSNSNLIFSGYGISGRLQELGLKLKYHTEDLDEADMSERPSTKDILSKLGMETEKDLYLYIYDKMTSYEPAEVYVMLNFLAKKGVLNIDKLLDLNNIEKATDELIQYMYANYISYEKETTGYTGPFPIESWGFRDLHTNKWVYLERDSYTPYALVFLVFNEIIDSDGAWINGI